MKFPAIVLLLILFTACVPQPPAEIVDIDECGNAQSSASKKQLHSAMKNLIRVKCDDLTQFKCDVRDFSPNVITDEEYDLEYCEDGECVKYDVYTFDTSDMREKDQHAKDEDFQKGGQYNYQEVTCWNQFKKKKKIVGQGDDVAEALNRAIASCEQLE
jgi:hypothetical protein